MKYVIVFLFLNLVSLTNLVFAQQANKDLEVKRLTINIIGAANFANLLGKHYSNVNGNIETITKNYTPFFGGTIGFSCDYSLTKKLSLQTALIYTTIGANLLQKTTIYSEFDRIEYKKTYAYSLSYLKIPLIVNYYPSPKFYISGGLYMAYNTFYTIKQDKLTSKLPKLEGVNPIDLGVIVAVGVVKSNFSYGVRYSYGLTKAISNDKESLHNSVFQLVFSIVIMKY